VVGLDSCTMLTASSPFHWKLVRRLNDRKPEGGHAELRRIRGRAPCESDARGVGLALPESGLSEFAGGRSSVPVPCSLRPRAAARPRDDRATDAIVDRQPLCDL